MHVVADREVMTLEFALGRVAALLGTGLDWATLESFLPAGSDRLRTSALASSFLAALELAKQGRAERAGRWHFQSAADCAHVLRREREEVRRLSRAGVETLAIVAYHEPVTRAEIEASRGVAVSPGTLDVLMEAGWIRPAGRREVPGRPLTYATTPEFLAHFGLATRRDLPGLDDLRAAGLLDPVDLAIEQLAVEKPDEDA